MNQQRFGFSIVIAIVVSLVLSSTAGGQAPATACGDPPPGYNVIETDQRFITGTTGPDFICAGKSNNIIRSRGENDIIFAGAGNDVIWAGYGNDTVWAGEGNDIIRAGGGSDAISAGPGRDTILGGTGADSIHGGDGDDTITGGDGHDLIDGDGGDDKLIGNRGSDRIVGGFGNDVGQGGAGNDSLVGGSGDDVLTGGDHDDTLRGGNGDDRLVGGSGTDTLTGGNGDDALDGGDDVDILRGSAGDDSLEGGNGLNTSIGGPGSDSCMNADSPKTSCEIVDGIDQDNPPARVWLQVPFVGSPVVRIGGTNWSPNAPIDITIVDGDSQSVGKPNTVTSTGLGDWELTVASDSLDGGSILAVDSNAGDVKTLVPVLSDFRWSATAKLLSITGPAGETMKAQIFAPGEGRVLTHVELMTFTADGQAESNFSQLTGIGELEVRRTDSDGDVEIHSDILGIVDYVAAVPADNDPDDHDANEE